jgi:hypothetical protein
MMQDKQVAISIQYMRWQQQSVWTAAISHLRRLSIVSIGHFTRGASLSYVHQLHSGMLLPYLSWGHVLGHSECTSFIAYRNDVLVLLYSTWHIFQRRQHVSFYLNKEGCNK